MARKTEQVTSVGVVRIESEDLPVQCFGLHQIAFTMAINRPLQSLLNGGHLDLVVVGCLLRVVPAAIQQAVQITRLVLV